MPGRIIHGRAAYLSGKCKCDDICRRAVREASTARRRAAGVPVSTDQPWSIQELASLAEDVPSRVLAERMGRTLGAVHRMRARTGLGRRKRGLLPPTADIRPWTVQEVLALAENVSSRELAQRLGRSERGVATMRQNTGMGRGQRGLPYKRGTNSRR